MIKKNPKKSEDRVSEENYIKSNTEEQDEISKEALKQLLSDNQDIIFSEILFGGNIKTTMVFVEGLVGSQLVDDFILKPLIQQDVFKDKTEKEIIVLIMDGAIYHNQRKIRKKKSNCLRDLLSGSVLLIFDDAKAAVTFDIKGFEKRSIIEPTNENVLKGSKEAFIEVLRVNTALVRRRIQTSTLKIQQITVGEKSHTDIAIVYLSDVANNTIVNAVKKRLSNFNLDAVSSAGQIEAFLLDNKYSFFPQILYTERVDKFCGNILEGRVGIIIDGLPLAYITPVDINSFLQAPEDYALNYIQSSAFRLLRHVCAFLALILPAFYVSITTFHREMIPTELAISIIASKQGVPFPTYLEVLLMLAAFEVLLEAGLRLPKAIGQTVSIVGALVIGQAAIAANMLSPGVVIVISSAGITGFVIPSQDLSNTIRLCRTILVILSIIGGLFTVSLGLICILYHLCSLEILGVPYFSPFAANEGRGMLKDTIFRQPWFNSKRRPSNLSTKDNTRQNE